MSKRALNALAAAACLVAATGCEAADAMVPAGLNTYMRSCAPCHQPGGVGMAGLAPPLSGTLEKFIANDDGRRYMASVMIYGLSGRITSKGQVFNLAMVPQAALSDTDLTDVANYLARVLNGAANLPFSVDDFARARASKVTHKDLRELRDRLLK